MPIDETIPYRDHAIVKQTIEAYDGPDLKLIDRFTIYGPDKQKLAQKMTLADAKADIDQRLS